VLIWLISTTNKRQSRNLIIHDTPGRDVIAVSLPDMQSKTGQDAHLKPVLQQNDTKLDDCLLYIWHSGEELPGLFFRTEAHDPLDARAVIPAKVEYHDFSGSREVWNIALNIHLGFFALGRRCQGADAKHARAYTLRNCLDRPALAGAVASFENNADLHAFMDDPLLQTDQFDMQFGKLR
jgi:hypothetical protein